MSNLTKRTFVLSGGGGRGAYHVGVYKYLEEQGLKPDVVVGTSIGAEVNQADNSKDCSKVILTASEMGRFSCCLVSCAIWFFGLHCGFLIESLSPLRNSRQNVSGAVSKDRPFFFPEITTETR